jgi:hypothetical protein
MPENYKPAGSDVTYVVPSLNDAADGPQAFRDFADTIPKALSPAVGVHIKAANYTLTVGDNGSLVSMDTSAGDLTVTLPVNSPTFLAPIGAVIVVGNTGKVRGKKVTIIAASGVTLRDSAVRVIELFRMVSLIQVEKDSWIINAGTGGAPAPGVPSAPKLNTAVAGPANITVGWAKPVDDGGSPLTGYTVETSKDSGKTWVIGGAFGPTILTGTLTGLTPAIVYQVRVKAANDNGFGDPSNVLTATPIAPFNNATGGDITTFVDAGKTFRRHTFLNNGTFTITQAYTDFTYVLFGGGAGGGSFGFDGGGPHGGGAGGGGGYYTTTGILDAKGYPAVVGQGGGNNGYGGNAGGDTSFNTFVAGGGGGGAWGQDAQIAGDGRTGNPNGTANGGNGSGANHPQTSPAAGKQGTWALSGSTSAGGAGGNENDKPGKSGSAGAVVIQYQIA